MIISPSVLSLHYDDFKNQLDALNESVEWLHFDVMDGNFVPNISFGPVIFSYFRKNSSLFMDVHLMVNDPEHYAMEFANKGAESITFHYENYNDPDECIKLIDKLHSLYLKAGISINPGTSVKDIEPLLNKVDLVLVMSVEPGFGGQKYIPSSTDKIKELDYYRKLYNLSYIIQVDGGINDQTAHEVLNAGCDCLVAGSYIFDGDIISNVNKLRSCK
ncbi:MAG: ribulose-phosphate 3-epimerase [Erysipelotrichaceae bacterium]|nr:ribulose-phosphate 3-epimerase [Erysipelotrichaceae bacterium]